MGSITKSTPAFAALERSDPEAPDLTSTTQRAFPSLTIAAARFISETSEPVLPINTE